MAAELLSLNCAGGVAGAVLRAATLLPRYQQPPSGVLPDQSCSLPSTSMEGVAIHLEVDSVSPLHPSASSLFPAMRLKWCGLCPRWTSPTPPPGVLRPNVLRGDVRGSKGGGRVSVRRSVGYLSELQIPTQGTHVPFFAQCARVRTAAVPPGIAAQRGSIHMPASAPRVCPDRASLYFCAFSIHPSVYVSYLFLTPQRVGLVRLLRSAGLAPLATLQRSHTPTIHCISGRAAQLARLPTPNNGRPYPLLPDSNLISKHPNTSEPPLLPPPAG